MNTDVRINPSTLNGDGRIALQPASDATWVATLSNGETAVEKTGNWTLDPGQPLPWVRLCHFLADENLHLTSLRLNFKGRTIHLPRAKFEKFDFDSLSPIQYSLSYKIEAEMDMNGGAIDQQVFVDLAAHYEDFAVHYVQNVTNGNESWIVITGTEALAKTPRTTKI